MELADGVSAIRSNLYVPTTIKRVWSRLSTMKVYVGEAYPTRALSRKPKADACISNRFRIQAAIRRAGGWNCWCVK